MSVKPRGALGLRAAGKAFFPRRRMSGSFELFTSIPLIRSTRLIDLPAMWGAWQPCCGGPGARYDEHVIYFGDCDASVQEFSGFAAL